jgi:2-polyprenyl-3-methyl-5-hydroxy-6-metoxy-1,4-benzoquinol methylase
VGDYGLAMNQEPDDDDHFRFRRCLALLEEETGKIQPGTVWLDLGCNQGQFLRMLVRSRRIVGTGMDDWDAGLKAPGPDDSWGYRQADLGRELPWSGPVQVISALEVIEHVVDTDGFLQRAYERLDSKGWIVISTPNINSLRNRIVVPMGGYPAGPEYRTVIHHVRMYNAAVLREHLEATGFDSVRLRGVGFLPFSMGLGRTRVSRLLADALPAMCANLIAVARKP